MIFCLLFCLSLSIDYFKKNDHFVVQALKPFLILMLLIAFSIEKTFFNYCIIMKHNILGVFFCHLGICTHLTQFSEFQVCPCFCCYCTVAVNDAGVQRIFHLK